MNRSIVEAATVALSCALLSTLWFLSRYDRYAWMRSETRRDPATRPTNTRAYFRNKPPRRAPELLPRFPSLSGVVQAIRRLRALVNRVTPPSAPDRFRIRRAAPEGPPRGPPAPPRTA